MTSAARTLAAIRPSLENSVLLMLVAGAWFGLVFPTEPLYFENQNTKFLHGMAAAGIGHLDRDWTAQTVDVLPVFTGIVYALHVFTPAFFCYVVQIALFAVFLHAFIEIARFAAGARGEHPWFGLMVGVLVVAAHFSNGGVRVFGGVAKQYLLGPALEPQSFGVLFLLAVVLFLKRRIEAALWLTTLPAIVHPGYVVPAGALILAFMLAAWLDPDRTRRPRLLVAIASLAATAASMLYLGWMILPTSAESWQAANDILAKIRIPRHAVPAYWFDFDAAAKIVGCLLALWLARKRSTDLFSIIAVCFTIAVGLTLMTVALDSSELGMISPWRISVYLVPLGLAVLIGQAVAACLDLIEKETAPPCYNLLRAALAVIVAAVTVKGVIDKLERYSSGPEPAHIAYMQETGDAKTLYLTNPFDMNVRLESGLPQLVSWKTHPYKDVEVLEWYRRFQLAERVFRGDAIDCAALDEAILTYGTTHLLVDIPTKTVDCGVAEAAFAQDTFRIYRLIR